MNQPRDYSDHDPDNDFWHDDRQARSHRRGLITIWVMGILGALIFAYATMADADAHSWYPVACCWGPSAGRQGDCAEIPDKSVREGPNGYQVTLAPGDHPMVKQPISFVVPYADAQTSQDGLYHVCFRHDMTARCFFAGARGS